MPSSCALWHPCTQMQHHEVQPPLRIGRASGTLLYDDHGNAIIDAISSWWVNIHGHCHPTINRAIAKQLDCMDHVMLAGLSHEPIEQLAEKLVQLAPKPLSRCFFADSGSAAIEIALKMSLQYWQQTRQQGDQSRNTFLSFENGYHGETLGSLSVTDIPLFTRHYEPLLIQHLKAPSPDLSLKPSTQDIDDWIDTKLNELRRLVSQHHKRLCAIIIEPLVQGAAGMKMYPARFLTALSALCNEYNIHLILDEIATGFGRTGTMFACEQAHISPDFLCLSKGLTAGYLPMSCVLTHDAVYEAFYSMDTSRGFLHSHSYTGNPLAAVAALASLDIFEREQTLKQNHQLITAISQQLHRLHDYSWAANIRQTGMIAALDIVTKNGQPIRDFSHRFHQYALQQGVLLRPIGQSIYLIPPYCVSSEQINQIIDCIIDGCELLTTHTAAASHSEAPRLP